MADRALATSFQSAQTLVNKIEAERVAAVKAAREYTVRWDNGVPVLYSAEDLVASLDLWLIINYDNTPGFRDTEKELIDGMNLSNMHRLQYLDMFAANRQFASILIYGDSHVYDVNWWTFLRTVYYNLLCRHYATQDTIMKERMRIWVTALKTWYPNYTFTYQFPNARTGPAMNPMTYVTTVAGGYTNIGGEYGVYTPWSREPPRALDSVTPVIYQ